MYIHLHSKHLEKQSRTHKILFPIDVLYKVHWDEVEMIKKNMEK